jgi:hypothetical protein
MVSKVIQCSCLRRREEGITSISEGERRMRDSSWFPREEATRGCNNAVVADSQSQVTSGLTRDER